VSTRAILSGASRIGALLLIGATGLLRSLLHEPAAVAQVEREVPEEVSEVTAQVRRCAPVVIEQDDQSLRAARCHIEKSRTEGFSLSSH
jgi:hypothetical protein